MKDKYYILHTKMGYFKHHITGKTFYILIEDDKATAIYEDDREPSHKLAHCVSDSREGFIEDGFWKRCKTKKEIIAYIFKLELDKTL